MDTFYDRLLKECKKAHTSPSAACQAVGINKNTAYYWRDHGSTPKPEFVKKLAEHLEISPDDLMPTDPKIDSHVKDFINLYNRLSKKDKMRLMALVYDFEDEINAAYRDADEDRADV